MENALHETTLHELAETDLCLVMCKEQSPKETVRDSARMEGSLWTPVTSRQVEIADKVEVATTWFMEAQVCGHQCTPSTRPASTCTANEWRQLLVATASR